MNYLKGYKPVELNKGDLKNLEKFSDLEEKYSNITDDLTAMLGDKEFEGSIFALRNKKEKKYKSIYIFKPEKDKDGNDILRFYKSVSTDDVSSEAVKEFEDIIMESLKETVSLDEKWSQIIWNDNVIEPRMIRLASINLSAGLFGIIFGLLLYIITGQVLWFVLGIAIGLTSGAIVSKIGEKKEEEKKETGMLPAENKSLEVQPEKGIEEKEETAVVNPEAEKSVVIKEENEDNND
ncbi:MAG: hypothetical protein IKE91_07220 [Clostridia bacterium]|nr:hypothetical protein [Clostridia bacterium]